MTTSTAIEGQNVTLTCKSDCSLTDKPTYIWYHYQNGQPLNLSHTEGQQMVVGPVCGRDAGEYSCAVKGQEELRSPEETLTVTCE